MDFVQSLIWHLKHKVCLNKLEIWLLIYSMKVKFQNKQLSSISCSFFFLTIHSIFTHLSHWTPNWLWMAWTANYIYIIYHNPRVNLVELCDLMTWNTGYYTWQINCISIHIAAFVYLCSDYKNYLPYGILGFNFMIFYTQFGVKMTKRNHEFSGCDQLIEDCIQLDQKVLRPGRGDFFLLTVVLIAGLCRT